MAMVSFLVAIPIFVAAQTSGMPAEEVTYVIYLESPEERIYGFVGEDEWDKPSLTVRIDEPWNGSVERRLLSRRITSKDRESRRARERRISQGWAENGGVEVETENGTRWVHKAEYELAMRTREMAGVIDGGASSETDRAVEARERESPPAENATPRFLELWGKHLAVIAAAAALTILVVWTLILK